MEHAIEWPIREERLRLGLRPRHDDPEAVETFY
jgi:hypothetical protein